VQGLGGLQQRASAYSQVQAQASMVRNLVGSIASLVENNAYLGRRSTTLRRQTLALEEAIVTLLPRLGSATAPDNLGFTPPAADAAIIGKISNAYRGLSTAMAKVVRVDKSFRGTTWTNAEAAPHAQAERLANELGALADRLLGSINSKTSSLIAQNKASYASSRNLFIGVSAGAMVLALLLGFVLSWSLIGPIQRIGSRLAAIASGDFSGHVGVRNRDELGELGANVNRMNDELQRLYGELETASRHKSEFLANMSHELRTPLNAIIGFSEVLHEQMFGELNERQLAYVNDVLGAGKHLLSLINDVLDLAKIEAGRMELELSRVAISDILESAVSIHAERASRGGIELALSTRPEEIIVTADERRLRQIVFNLVSNAVKFTPSGGRVEISALAENGQVEIAVADTGPGIAAEDLETIFEEFEQTTEGRKAEGTGLGLPLSRKLVELHGGHLWAESEPGHGSTFSFTLPVRREAAAA
jgi:signal transduction histidine kinase